MSAVDFWRTFLEAAAVILLIVGFVNEKRVVDFEKALAKAIREHLKARKNRKKCISERSNTNSLEKENEPTTLYVTTYDTWKNSKVKGSRYDK